jgi:hypothetical protein
LEVQSYSRNIGWSVINRNDFGRPKVSTRLLTDLWSSYA